MAIDVKKFIAACFEASKKETRNRVPVIVLNSPDGYYKKVIKMTDWDGNGSFADFLANVALDWFNKVINKYTEDEFGNIVRLEEGQVNEVDINIALDDLIAKAEELGLTGQT